VRPVLSTSRIERLLKESKPLTISQRQTLLNPVPKAHSSAGDEAASIYVTGSSGTVFILAVRKTPNHDHRFTVRLAIPIPRGRQTNLIRCNGWHNQHMDSGGIIPANTCHVHRTTMLASAVASATCRVSPEETATIATEFVCFRSAVLYLTSHFGCFLDTRRPLPFPEQNDDYE